MADSAPLLVLVHNVHIGDYDIIGISDQWLKHALFAHRIRRLLNFSHINVALATRCLNLNRACVARIALIDLLKFVIETRAPLWVPNTVRSKPAKSTVIAPNLLIFRM